MGLPLVLATLLGTLVLCGCHAAAVGRSRSPFAPEIAAGGSRAGPEPRGERASPPTSPPGSPSPGGPAGAALGGEGGGPRRLAPLAAPAALVELEVPGHLPALVVLPLGASVPKPVVVATHGAGGRPDGPCRLWQALLADRAFVLCLRGIATNRFEPADRTGYYYPGHPALGQELSAALAALVARYPDYVDRAAPLYAGFSQGASMGALLLPSHSAGFARAALIEGGYGQFQEWNVAAARRFRAQGGERVLLACGRLRCLEQAQRTARYLERGGLRVRLLYAPSAGHSYRGAMEQELRRALDWLLEGDSRF
jgi:predicted esterase